MEPWRRIQVGGSLLAVSALLLLAFAYSKSTVWGAGLSAAMLAELVTGREAAIPLALAAGTPAWLVAATSIAQNLALAALLVPLARQSIGTLGGDTFVARFMRALQETATQRLQRGRSTWGLFAFMLVPFVANGPVLAGMIGNLAGLAPRRIVAAVVPAVVITATAWTCGYAALTKGLQALIHASPCCRHWQPLPWRPCG